MFSSYLCHGLMCSYYEGTNKTGTLARLLGVYSNQKEDELSVISTDRLHSQL